MRPRNAKNKLCPDCKHREDEHRASCVRLLSSGFMCRCAGNGFRNPHKKKDSQEMMKPGDTIKWVGYLSLGEMGMFISYTKFSRALVWFYGDFCFTEVDIEEIIHVRYE